MCLSVPAKIESIIDETAVCSVGGALYEANIQLLASEEVQVGDFVLLHAGFAIQKLCPEEAQATLELFESYKSFNRLLDEEEKRTAKRIV